MWFWPGSCDQISELRPRHHRSPNLATARNRELWQPTLCRLEKGGRNPGIPAHARSSRGRALQARPALVRGCGDVLGTSQPGENLAVHRPGRSRVDQAGWRHRSRAPVRGLGPTIAGTIPSPQEPTGQGPPPCRSGDAGPPDPRLRGSGPQPRPTNQEVRLSLRLRRWRPFRRVG